MQEKRLIRFKSLMLSALLCLSLNAFAQDTAAIKWIDHNFFDRDLIPARHIYGDSWDSLHVDSPSFEPSRMMFGYNITLTDEECEYIHPISGKINSIFGWRWNRMHKGIDLDLEIGDPVYAAFDGVVRISKVNPGGYGNYVLIRHYNGLETLYGHLSKRLVECNESVKAGDVIGYGGNTGRSTGPHLHFETRFKGIAFDPDLLIDFNTYKLKKNTIYIDKSWFPYLTNPYEYRKRFATYHKIRSGDTLYGIARKYGTTVNKLCSLNRISRTTILRPGRTLQVR